MTPADRIARVMELSKLATPEPLEVVGFGGAPMYVFGLNAAMVGDVCHQCKDFRIRGVGDGLPMAQNAQLIAEYRTLAPALAEDLETALQKLEAKEIIADVRTTAERMSDGNAELQKMVFFFDTQRAKKERELRESESVNAALRTEVETLRRERKQLRNSIADNCIQWVDEYTNSGRHIRGYKCAFCSAPMTKEREDFKHRDDCDARPAVTPTGETR